LFPYCPNRESDGFGVLLPSFLEQDLLCRVWRNPLLSDLHSKSSAEKTYGK